MFDTNIVIDNNSALIALNATIHRHIIEYGEGYILFKEKLLHNINYF